LSDARYDSLGL